MTWTPASALLLKQIDKAAAKGYTYEHDQRHGADRLLAASQAYTVWSEVHLNYPGTDDHGDTYGWPFSDGWNPDPDPAVTLVKAAQLLLAAADVIIAERASGAS